MKSTKITNLGNIRNELNRYKRGKKFDIHQFNQVARLAWLGRVVMQPLDPETAGTPGIQAEPEDTKSRAFLLFVQEPDELAAHFLNTDQELTGAMHIVDGDQAEALIQILRGGVEERAKLYEDLSRSDFYFRHFYRPKGERTTNDDVSPPSGSSED